MLVMSNAKQLTGEGFGEGFALPELLPPPLKDYNVSRALARALAEVAATLAEHAAADPAAATLVRRCVALQGLPDPPLAAPFARAVRQAADQLVREHGSPAEALLALLATDAAPVQHFLCVALEELLLAATPDVARLVEVYRRDVRPAMKAHNPPLPPWLRVGPLVTQFLRDLLPQTLAQQARLRHLFFSHAEKTALENVRVAQRATPLPLLEQFGQALVATNGAAIAHVQQTIVHGDLVGPLPLAPSDLALLYARYRAFVAETYGNLDFRGLLQIQAATRLGLDQIYIEVQARLHQGACEARSLHAFVREEPLLVILGDPGSGKSTLVRYVLLALTRGDAQAQLGLEPLWLPIFFPVAAFAAARARQPDLAPLDYLSDYYRGLSQPAYGPLFARALALGRALLLFDGLDEVREDRRTIVHALEACAREWDAAGNRFIATARIVGYDEAPLDPSLFTTVVLEPLAAEQIACFIERWARAYATLGAAAAPPADPLLDDLVRAAAMAELERQIALRSASLHAAVFGEHHVTALAHNPLLLTILALIHNQGARLPDRRVELYRLCLVALAETWNRARSLSGRPVDVHLGDELLDERFVVNLLGPVALWLHGEQAGGLVDQDVLVARIAATLEQTDGLARPRARRLAHDFVELMRRETGLLQERGYRRFGFLHLTFEEYLAARGLLESLAVVEPEALLCRWAADVRWREVLRLAVAAAPQREAGRLLQVILRAPSAGNDYGRPVVLAGECLLDVGRNGAGGQAWDAVTHGLMALVDDPGAAVTMRVAAGTTLGQLGDLRLLDAATGRADAAAPDYWCDVAAGPFWWGDELAQGRKVALQSATLPYGLRIAR
ncbi:MAG: NACHT domain-containing protein, partial [Candidatus Viridilinea halotolerans]